MHTTHHSQGTIPSSSTASPPSRKVGSCWSRTYLEKIPGHGIQYSTRDYGVYKDRLKIMKCFPTDPRKFKPTLAHVFQDFKHAFLAYQVFDSIWRKYMEEEVASSVVFEMLTQPLSIDYAAQRFRLPFNVNYLAANCWWN